MKKYFIEESIPTPISIPETDTCGDNLIRTLDYDDGTLTISGTGAMTYYSYPYAIIWNDDHYLSIKKVVIGDGVTTIGKSAFAFCLGLKSVTIPDSVTAIGEGAFSGCRKLTKLTIPDAVAIIGRIAFSGCSKLTGVTIPDSVETIDVGAFFGCRSLMSIEVAENNPAYCSVNGVLFDRSCTELVCFPGGKEGAFVIPDSVTTIGKWAFACCPELKKVTIPDSVTTIDDWAFCQCRGLKIVIIPDSVTAIGECAFRCCGGLKIIEVSENNPAYRSVDGVLFDRSCTELVCFPGGKEGAFVIPDSVTTIGEGAFSDCSGLMSITIPDSVTTIGESAFYHCLGLTSVTIPNGVTTIGKFAFSGCSYITSVTIPDSVTTIGRFAFSGCSRLKTVKYSGNKTNLDDIFIGSGNDALLKAEKI